MEIEFGALSDVGRARGNNEDSFAIAADLNLFVLSDGMGGLAAGEVASRLTAETVVNNCRAAASNPSLPLIGEHLPGLSKASNRLASAIRTANRDVYAAAQSDKKKRGMGATVVAVWIMDSQLRASRTWETAGYTGCAETSLNRLPRITRLWRTRFAEA